MTTTLPTTASAALEQRLRELEDRTELTSLVDRFVQALDDPDQLTEDRYRTLLTEDVRLTLPNGTHQGVAGLPGFLDAPKALWARSQHYATNTLVEVDGDRAGVSANLQAVHVPHDDADPVFVGGARYDARAERTPAGWRLSEVAVAVRWGLSRGRG